MNFKDYFNETTHTHSKTPVLDAMLPSVKKTGKIQILMKNKNPILIQLSDGTKLFLTWDEFRRIKGNVEVGKTMTVLFQRHTHDNSVNPSQIQSISVLH